MGKTAGKKSELHWLLLRIRPFWRLHLTHLVALFLSSALTLVDPLLLKWILDDLIPWRKTDQLILAGISFFLLYCFRYALSGIAGVLDFYASERVVLAIRLELLEHLQGLPAEFHDNASVGDLLHRLEHDASNITRISSQVVGTSVRVGVTTLLALVIMMVLSVKLTLIILLLIPALVLVRRFAFPRLRQAADRVQQESAKRSSFLQDHLATMLQIQLLHQEVPERRRFLVLARRLLEAQVGQRAWDIFLMLASLLVSIAAVSLALTVGGFETLAGTMTLGGLIAFYTYVTRFFDPLQNLATLYSSIQSAGASIRRVREVLDRETEIRDPPKPTEMPAEPRGLVELRRVSFHYKPEREILREISLRFEPGRKVAVVGESGGGKSTLLRLLPRVYDPFAGEVLLDGINVRDFRRRDLRRVVALVPQDPLLLDRSLRENLLFGQRAASPEELRQVLEMTQLEAAASRIGLEQAVGPRGTKLSGGERQRVALARALLRRPKVLILDEATSALDGPTEKALLHALEKIAQETTILLIAHRMSSVLWADRIIVLEAGQLVGDGEHQELYASNATYRRLCEEQLREEDELANEGST